VIALRRSAWRCPQHGHCDGREARRLDSKAITEDLGIKLENIKLEDLGKAKKVVLDKDNTTIVEGAGKTKEIEGRIKQIRAQIEETTSTTTARSCRSGWPSWPAAWR